jgi:hypothetical protein
MPTKFLKGPFRPGQVVQLTEIWGNQAGYLALCVKGGFLNNGKDSSAMFVPAGEGYSIPGPYTCVSDIALCVPGTMGSLGPAKD